MGNTLCKCQQLLKFNQTVILVLLYIQKSPYFIRSGCFTFNDLSHLRCTCFLFRLIQNLSVACICFSFITSLIPYFLNWFVSVKIVGEHLKSGVLLTFSIQLIQVCVYFVCHSGWTYNYSATYEDMEADRSFSIRTLIFLCFTHPCSELGLSGFLLWQTR